MLKPVTPSSLRRAESPNGGDAAESIADLERKTGAIQRLRSDVATSSIAGKALRVAKARQIEAHARLADTAISIAESQLTTAMVTRAMPVIAGMVERLNASANAADQALSEQEAAAIQDHLRAREEVRAEILRASNRHGIPEAEVAACISFAEANAAHDVERARERTMRAKQANEALSQRALDSVLAAKLPSDRK